MKKLVVEMWLNYKGKARKRCLGWINENASNSTILDYVKRLASLTKNKLGEVFKYTKGEVGIEELDEKFVTAEELKSVLDGSYNIVEDANGITGMEIELVISGEYEAGESGITAADIAKILKGGD